MSSSNSSGGTDESQDRIAAGGLPLATEQRLQRQASGGLFTSRFSTDGLALCGPADAVPVSQVMGSSVLYVRSGGYGPYFTRRQRGHAMGAELKGLSNAFNQVRERAFKRLRLEAQACGAHAVVGVRTRLIRLDARIEAIEYTVDGTAVRLHDRPAHTEPILTDLQVDDYWKLIQAGYEPVGIAAASVVYETVPSAETTRALAGMRFHEGRTSREIPEFSATVSGAVGLALARASESARALNAEHLLGIGIDRQVEAIERDNYGRTPLKGEPAKRKDLRITVHVLGTATREPHAKRERTERGTWRTTDPASRPRGVPGYTALALNASRQSPEANFTVPAKIGEEHPNAQVPPEAARPTGTL